MDTQQNNENDWDPDDPNNRDPHQELSAGFVRSGQRQGDSIPREDELPSLVITIICLGAVLSCAILSLVQMFLR